MSRDRETESPQTAAKVSFFHQNDLDSVDPKAHTSFSPRVASSGFIEGAPRNFPAPQAPGEVMRTISIFISALCNLSACGHLPSAPPRSHCKQGPSRSGWLPC